MAFSSSLVNETVEGNHRVKGYTWDATGVTTGTVTHGLKGVVGVTLTNNSNSGGSVSDSSGVATIANVTAGDTGYLEVKGY